MAEEGDEEVDEDVLEMIQETSRHMDNTTSDAYLGGWCDWIQDVQYPECPECGEAMREVVLNMDTLSDIDFMWGDSGTGQVCQCETHRHIMALTWASH
ncbi:protein of unknown function DUF1963 [Kipferlia bialata]|uniref:Uncharacterized protein n=1 Tax=Kipferlia bialata TaxID=797122 RepID=A0A9K3GDR2_9EUKA|nr:protein of unknown function DUF1963 [Kipferlia bialata]|eukprot:g845.t1